MSSEIRDGQRPRSPGVVYTAVTSVMLVLLGVVALRATQPPPPSIAEFAPQAVEQISDAPEEQQSRFGRGGGSGPCVEGVDCPDGSTVTPAPGPSDDRESISVPRVRHCVGDPPRQIEDPQSPPCVPYWEGDNGGETWKGVDRHQIRVVSPFYIDTIHPHLEAFFNRRFEFYGRKIHIIPGDNGGGSQEAQRAEAERADEERKAFASLHYYGSVGYQYMQEIARRKLIGVWSYASADEGSMAAASPHLWQYVMPVDRILRDQGDWACNRLAGLNAIHAGDDATRATPRKFGLILERLSADPVTGNPLEAALNRCGEELGEARVEGFRVASSVPDATNVILRMKREGVTSIFCICQSQANLSAAATSQRYFPEWLLSSFGFLDSNFYIKLFSPEQRSQTFGVSYQPRHVAISDEPPTHAIQEGGGSTEQSSDPVNREYLHVAYRGLLLLASGIQMAGPDLTPATFERGLHRTRFPNPSTSINAGRVGFETGDHGMTDDATEFWWSNTASGPYAGEDGNGAMCYVDGGRRHVGAGWSRALGDHTAFFNGACDSGA